MNEQIIYENQRWFPFTGWTSNLLPTDRFPFSSKDGKQELKKETFIIRENEKLIKDWTINLENCDKNGWEYAIDFPAKYTPTKNTLSCVRRRKWIRITEIVNENKIHDNEFKDALFTAFEQHDTRIQNSNDDKCCIIMSENNENNETNETNKNNETNDNNNIAECKYCHQTFESQNGATLHESFYCKKNNYFYKNQY